MSVRNLLLWVYQVSPGQRGNNFYCRMTEHIHQLMAEVKPLILQAEMFLPETVHPSLSREAIDEYISTVMGPLSRAGGGERGGTTIYPLHRIHLLFVKSANFDFV